MKSTLKLAFLLVVLGAFTACGNGEEPLPEEKLEANHIHVAGTWQLTHWNGAPLDTNLYCYMVLERRESTFTMYENMSTMYANKRTGTFSIYKDKNSGSIDLISGVYDYEQGTWSHVYQLEVYANHMVWSVGNHPSDVQIYRRCAAIPEEVLNGSRAAVIANPI